MAIAPSNPNRVYALIETGDGVPWKGKETDRGSCGARTTAARLARGQLRPQRDGPRALLLRMASSRPTTRTRPTSSPRATACSLDGGETLGTDGGAARARR